MPRTFCVTVDLVGGLQLSDRKLKGFLIDKGRRLSVPEARAVFVEKLRAGFDVLPVCENHDAKGHCLGHEQENQCP